MDKNSCPNCEYETGKPGRPTLRGDTIHCLDCGTSWKDISANPAILLENNSREKTLDDLRNMLREKHNKTLWDTGSHNASQSNNTIDFPDTHGEPSQRNTAMTIATALLGVFIMVGGAGTYFWPHTEKGDRSIVSLSDIELKEQIGRAGRKVITVKGLVENGTNEYQAIRPISIILRRKDGGEIVRWRHVSHKPILKAGAKSRFASSIQYDTPLVAYAEAVFE